MRLRNLLPALLEHTKDWLVGKALQQIGDDNEANYLREKELGIPAKGFSCLPHSVAEICRQEYRIHKLKCPAGANASTCNLLSLSGPGKGRRRRSLPSMRSRELRARERA